ncbi:MAG: DUF1919 domain-containing protein [Bacteroidetes bacterium]|nr:DUF1919 domain-containing protein [Bacteroidota bacterium]
MYARLKIRNKNFTIISNNCWAWSIYEDLGMAYTTPTIGLYFFMPCYLKFISNLPHYLQTPLSFKRDSIYEEGNMRLSKNKQFYPVGQLGDIEIHFLHYHTEEEALAKWKKRVARVNFDNLFIAGSDIDLCTPQHIQSFNNLPYKNKVFFSAKPYPEFKSVVWLKYYREQPTIGDITKYRWPCRKYFDVVNWLNKGK